MGRGMVAENRLAFDRSRLQNDFDILAKAHVQHHVDFVEDG